ncbi:YqzL family protein [Anaerosolibacter sp.]
MENILWKLFMNTGDIRYYLQYKGIEDSVEKEYLEQSHYEVKEAILR